MQGYIGLYPYFCNFNTVIKKKCITNKECYASVFTW